MLFWCVRRVLFVPQKNGKREDEGYLRTYRNLFILDLLSVYVQPKYVQASPHSDGQTNNLDFAALLLARSSSTRMLDVPRITIIKTSCALAAPLLAAAGLVNCNVEVRDNLRSAP